MDNSIIDRLLYDYSVTYTKIIYLMVLKIF